jgi:phosphatidylinositol-3-phosphatase
MSSARKLFVATTATAAVTVVVAILAFGVFHAPANPPAASDRHIWLIVMENRADTSIIGRKDAPYLNSLLARYATSTNYRALVHGSQPNYIALFSGALQGVQGNEAVSIRARSLADQIEAAGKTWRVFAQNVPPNCFAGSTATGGPDGNGTYARKHEPAISFSDIANSPSRCGKISNFTSFDPMAADFELIVPNLENDMHNGTTKKGDDFVRGFIPRILATPAWKSGSPLFITWDEGKAQGANRIVTFVVASTVRAGFESPLPHTHYSLLRTIQELLGLPCLAQSCHANDLAEFFPGVLAQSPAGSAGPSP